MNQETGDRVPISRGRKRDVIEKTNSLQKIRTEFMKQHGQQVKTELSNALGNTVKITPAPVSALVVSRFSSCTATVSAASARIVPVFHGTEARNHASIFKHGFQLPGQQVKIRNGLSHGVGTYVSNVSSAWLSREFCTQSKMIVCALVDDATPLKTPTRIGNFFATAESSSVRHIGSALVVFNPSRLLPLYEASWTQIPLSHAIATPIAQPCPPAAPKLDRPFEGRKIDTAKYFRRRAARRRQ